MFDQAFADIAIALSSAFGGPFHAGVVRWPGVPVMEGGSIVTPATPATAACQVQIDVVTEAMRAEAGYTDRDMRLIVLAPGLPRAVDTSATVEVLAGPNVPAAHVGVWMVQSNASDTLGCAYDGRGVVVKITGSKAFSARLKRLTSPEAHRQIGAALFAAGQEIEVEAAISITTGAVSGKGHVASRPGEPPNADTHVLDRSIETNQVEVLRVEVSANAPYAVAQEFGRSNMPARPYLGPATAKKRKEATALVRAAVAKINRGGNVV